MRNEKLVRNYEEKKLLSRTVLQLRAALCSQMLEWGITTFLTYAIDGGEWPVSRSTRFTTGKNPQEHMK